MYVLRIRLNEKWTILGKNTVQLLLRVAQPNCFASLSSSETVYDKLQLPC